MPIKYALPNVDLIMNFDDQIKMRCNDDAKYWCPTMMMPNIDAQQWDATELIDMSLIELPINLIYPGVNWQQILGASIKEFTHLFPELEENTQSHSDDNTAARQKMIRGVRRQTITRVAHQYFGHRAQLLIFVLLRLSLLFISKWLRIM